MATGVFGVPVTKETLIATGMYSDPSKITQKDIASYAETMMSTDGRDKDALTYVENLKSNYGNGVSALFVFYNATGAPLTFIESHDYHGHSYDRPYPSHRGGCMFGDKVENGQWGAFLHVHTSGAAVGSSAAVVYRGNLYSDTKDWLISWDVPWSGSNKVFAEIHDKDHWPTVESWDVVHKLLEKSGSHSEDKQSERWCDMNVANGPSPVIRAIMKLL